MNYSKTTEGYFKEVVSNFKDVKFGLGVIHNITKLPEPLENKNESKCIVRVVDADTFDTAKTLKNPLVLNMASDYVPGGGWRKGSIAQEEVMFYRSTYALSLEPLRDQYPLSWNQIIYSKNVCVFMDSDYKVLPWDQCYFVDCVAVPGLRRPKLENNKLSKSDTTKLHNKIEAIFKFAIVNNYKTMVLGALGCGAFKNPPEDVAQIFKLAVNKYSKYFDEIIFAVLSVKDTNNFRTFKRILQ